MLKISVIDDEASVKLKLEGKLAGPWVEELRCCWLKEISIDPRRSIVTDLTEVSFVDAAGEELLAEMCGHGVEFVSAGCLMRAIVQEIQDQVDSIRTRGSHVVA
jgi:hypothetical protein